MAGSRVVLPNGSIGVSMSSKGIVSSTDCVCCSDEEVRYCNLDSHPDTLSDDFSGSVNWTAVRDITVANTSGEMVLTEGTGFGVNGRAESPELSAISDPLSLVAEIELRQVPSTSVLFEINDSELGFGTDVNVLIQASATQYFVGGFAPGLGTPILGPALPIAPTVGDIWRFEFGFSGVDFEDVTATIKINGTTYGTRSSTNVPGLNHCGIKASIEITGNCKFDDFSADYS